VISLVGWVDRLEVRCQCCDRYGRLRLGKLIEEHGADMDLPDPAARRVHPWRWTRMLLQPGSPVSRPLIVLPSWLSLPLMLARV
jgi:hypothetical protein